MLGILSFMEYQEFHAQLDEGDALVIYSDGVTEANNSAGDEFEDWGPGGSGDRGAKPVRRHSIIGCINKALVTLHRRRAAIGRRHSHRRAPRRRLTRLIKHP